MTGAEITKALELQEDILQFSHFTNADAWELGNLLVKEARSRGLTLAIQIRLNNGLIVFQYAFDGVNCYNFRRLDRKNNTVRLMEKSSLYMCMLLEKSNETLQDLSLSPEEVGFYGGGFPIRLEDAGVIGSIAVSGIGHIQDHDFIIKVLSKYLHVDEVPRIGVDK